MKMFNKKEIWDYFIKNRSDLLRLALKLNKSLEKAEDVIQESAINLMSIRDDYEVPNMKKFLGQVIVQRSFLRTRRNKKYLMIGDEKIDFMRDQTVEYSVDENLDNMVEAILFKEISKEVSELPQKQREAIYYMLENDGVAAKDFGLSYKEFQAVSKNKTIGMNKLKAKMEKWS